VSYFYNKIYISLVCDPSDIYEADYFLVTDNENISELIVKTNEDLYQRNYNIYNFIKGTKMNFKEELISSQYLGEEYSNEGEEIIVIKFYLIPFNIFIYFRL